MAFLFLWHIYSCMGHVCEQEEEGEDLQNWEICNCLHEKVGEAGQAQDSSIWGVERGCVVKQNIMSGVCVPGGVS